MTSSLVSWKLDTSQVWQVDVPENHVCFLETLWWWNRLSITLKQQISKLMALWRRLVCCFLPFAKSYGPVAATRLHDWTARAPPTSQLGSNYFQVLWHTFHDKMIWGYKSKSDPSYVLIHELVVVSFLNTKPNKSNIFEVPSFALFCHGTAWLYI